MIVRSEREPGVSGIQRKPVSPWRGRLPHFPARRTLIIFFALFALIILLQMASGAYRGEFGGYPDEPAHYVTSLMVREYITHPHPLSPMKFAEDYYRHYPKVAFGHWPPFFYAVQAIWMVLFSCSRASVLIEIALTTALLGYLVYLEGRRWFGATPGILAALLTVCLPLVQTSADEEMAETLLVLLCFLSTIYFARYLDSQRWQDNVWFGVFFSLAVLTKGSGWLLALVPVIALVLTRKLWMILRPSFWPGVAIVAVSCIPWQLSTMQLAERGWTGGSHPSGGYLLSALAQFLIVLVRIPGSILSVLVLAGIVVSVFVPAIRKPVASIPAAMLALILADWIFHSLVPAGIEDRKMIMAAPALVLFLFAGGIWLADHLPMSRRLASRRRMLVAVAGALVFAVQTFAIPYQKHYGYIEAASFLTSRPELQPATILTSSNSGGEGLLISEIAMRQPRPVDLIIRGTKALAKVDWTGSDYQSLYSNPTDLVAYLDAQHVDVVVVDTFAGDFRFLHHGLLKQAIRQSGRFKEIAAFPQGSTPDNGQVQVYRFTPR